MVSHTSLKMEAARSSETRIHGITSRPDNGDTKSHRNDRSDYTTSYSNLNMKITSCWIGGSPTGGYEEFYFLGYNIV
jgi:hypothetical protein